MRKALLVLLASVALVTGGLGAGTAHAVTSSASCNTGGTTFTFTLNHNDNTYTAFGWSTNPAAKLNRMTLTEAYDPMPNLEFHVVNYGGNKDTLNDVASSATHVKLSSWPRTVYNVRYWRVWAWGGVGNSTDSCTTPWRPIFT